MARVWSTSGSTDMNDPVNYSGSGPLLITDDLVFDGTSVVNAVATADLEVNSITLASNYTGTWTFGYDLTVTAGINFSGTGALTLSNSNINSGGDILIASTVGTLAVTACNVTMSGTSNWTNNKGGSAWGVFTVAEDSTVEMNGSVNQYFNGAPPLVIGNNSTFTLNQSTRWYVTSSGSAISLPANYTLAGAQSINFFSATALTITIPAIASDGGGFSFYNGSSGITTYNQNGNIICSSTSSVFNVKTITAGDIVFNTNNYNITGGNLNCGCVTAGDTVTVNLGSSVLNFEQMGNLVTSYSAGTCYFNMSTCQMRFGGNLTIRDWMIVDAGASLITFDGSATNSQLIVATGQALYDIVVNKNVRTMTNASNISCHSYTISTTNTGAFLNTNYVITANGNITFDGNSTLNLGNGLTLNGASSTLHIGSTVSTVTGTNCVVTMNGTTSAVIDDVKGVAIKSLILGNSAIVSGTPSSVSSATTPFILGTNAQLTLTKTFTVFISGNVDSHSFASGYQLLGTSLLRIAPLEGISITIPSITRNTGSVYILFNGNSTATLTGPMNCSATLRIYAAAYTFTFNQGGQNITCGNTLGIGNSANGNATYNFDGNIDVQSFENTFTSGNVILNLGTSNWRLGGNLTLGPNYTIDRGNSKINIINEASIVCAGKSLNYVVISAPTKIVTLQDDLRCELLTIADGTLNKNGKSVYAGSDDVFVGSGLDFGDF
jgi:fibronectin-binding autotransporter adhesin